MTDDIQLNAEGVDNLQTLEYEFKHNVNDFLSKQKCTGKIVRRDYSV